MAPDPLFCQLLLVALVFICLILHIGWPDPRRPAPQTTAHPDQPRRKRSKEPKPFAGYIHKPICEACEQGLDTRPKAPGSPPPMIILTRGRRRIVATSGHFCPDHDCAYHGWLGRGNIRANGHPGGQPWHQFPCVSCQGYFSETHGTIFHGKRSSVELIVRVIACLAEGLGIRGTARVFEIDPHTVLGWLVEAAEQLKAFSTYFLHDLHLNQVQLDELYAVLSAVRDGDMRAAEAIERLARSPPLGVDGDRPCEQIAVERPGGGTHPGHGASRVASHLSAVSAWLCTALSERRIRALPHRHRDAIRALGAAASAPSERPRAQVALDAAAWSTLCASGQADAAGSIASCLARKRRWAKSWRFVAGRSRRRLSNGSISACASGWRRSGVVAPRRVSTKRG